MRNPTRIAALSVALSVLVSVPAVAQSPSPETVEPAGVQHEVLGTLWHDGLGDDMVYTGRTTLEPGAFMPATYFNGDWTARVDSGVLTISDVDGRPMIDDESWDQFEWDAGGARDDLGAGSQLTFGPGTVMAWANEGAELTVILTTAIVDDDDEPMILASDVTPRPKKAIRGDVVKRIVLEGPSQGIEGYDYRITVRDRSGQLLDARVPHERELRFLERWTWDGNITLGPVAPSPGEHEVLVTWMASVCGPVATIDIGRDVSAIRVADRSGGCDSAGMHQSVVLRFKGSWTEVEDVEGIVVYR